MGQPAVFAQLLGRAGASGLSLVEVHGSEAWLGIQSHRRVGLLRFGNEATMALTYNFSLSIPPLSSTCT